MCTNGGGGLCRPLSSSVTWLPFFETACDSCPVPGWQKVRCDLRPSAGVGRGPLAEYGVEWTTPTAASAYPPPRVEAMRQNAAMVTGGVGNDAVENGVLVRYWAGARAAAGVDKEIVPGPLTLSELLGEVVARHADRPRLKDVVSVCSVLVGDRPTGRSDPATVVLRPGDTVELLPPFAGG